MIRISTSQPPSIMLSRTPNIRHSDEHVGNIAKTERGISAYVQEPPT